MKKPGFDYILLFSVITLTAIGTIMIFSASPTMGLKLGDTFYFIKRQILYLLLGFSALYLALTLELKTLKKWSFTILLFSLFLLLLVFIPGVGKKISGASRWIDLIIISFQPSELIKLSIVLFLANLLSTWDTRIKNLTRGFLSVLIWVGIVLIPILLQPDMGTTIVIGATSFVLLFAAGAYFYHLLSLAGFGILGALVISLTSPYRLQRLLAYLDPWKDPQGIGFQIIQSLLAVGSGGFMGFGLGASRQKFFYLPQQFTDFIFAILCEELGFIGGIGVIILFALFTARGFRIALSADGRFNSLLAVGITSWLSLQAAINMMVVVGLIPTTGIPLPFISYGGTATILNLFAVGILLNISLTGRTESPA